MKIRIGLLIDDFNIFKWQKAVLDELPKDCSELSLIVVGIKKRRNYRTKKGFLYNAYLHLEKYFLGIKNFSFDRVNIEKLIARVPTIGFDDFCSSEDYKVDVFLNFNSMILCDDIVESAKYGYLDILYDKMCVNGGIPFLYECLCGRKTAQTTLRCFVGNKNLSIGEIIAPVSIFFTRSLNELFWHMPSLVSAKIRELRNLDFNEFANKYSVSVVTNFSNRHKVFKMLLGIFCYVLRLVCYIVKRYLVNKKLIIEQWTVRFSFGNFSSIEDIGSLIKKNTEVKCVVDGFYADPFVVKNNDAYYIFIEELINNTNRGCISYLKVNQDGVVEGKVKSILDKEYHLSYPFIFEFEDNYYMIPESAENRTVDIYKCINFPDQWVFHKNIMSNVRAYDTTLLFYDKLWWLFTSITQYDGMSDNGNLHIFYSDSPFSDEWIPHKKNPVILDVRKARAGGAIFNFKGDFYRPAQDCSVRYGYAVTLNKIICLNKDDYVEVAVSKLLPSLYGRSCNGLHTINFVNDFVVLDSICTCINLPFLR